MAKARTGRRAPLNIGEAPRLDASNDTAFVPDHALADGDVIRATAGRWRRWRRPATPPTTWRSRSRDGILFSGDHVMAWSTPVVAPPDGAMSDYMASLDKLARRTEASISQAMAAGCATRRASCSTTSAIARRARLRSCTGCQGREPISRRMVRAIYVGLDPRLAKAAGLSVLAHLEDLVARGEVATEGAPEIGASYRLR